MPTTGHLALPSSHQVTGQPSMYKVLEYDLKLKLSIVRLTCGENWEDLEWQNCKFPYSAPPDGVPQPNNFTPCGSQAQGLFISQEQVSDSPQNYSNKPISSSPWNQGSPTLLLLQNLPLPASSWSPCSRAHPQGGPAWHGVLFFWAGSICD